ncbi:hypothetical protein K523DRAFT_217766, partial [Schizophyllum commune Tattone D]
SSPSEQLGSHIAELQKLTSAVTLPKTKNAKTCSVPIATWNTICRLTAALARCEHASPSPDATISRIAANVEALSAKFDKAISQPSPQPQPSTVAAAPAPRPSSSPHVAYTPPPMRPTDADVVLKPKDRRHTPFAKDAPSTIVQHLHTALANAHIATEKVHPFARAFTRLRSGLLRFELCSPDEAQLLRSTHERWLPSLSPNLELHTTSCSLAVHGVPTTFDTYNHDGRFEAFLEENAQRIPNFDKAVGVYDVDWLGGRTGEQLRLAGKAHSTLVVRVKDPEVANAAIKHRLAFDGMLFRTEKYRSRPILCWNCFGWGHIAAQCRRRT